MPSFSHQSKASSGDGSSQVSNGESHQHRWWLGGGDMLLPLLSSVGGNQYAGPLSVWPIGWPPQRVLPNDIVGSADNTAGGQLQQTSLLAPPLFYQQQQDVSMMHSLPNPSSHVNQLGLLDGVTGPGFAMAPSELAQSSLPSTWAVHHQSPAPTAVLPAGHPQSGQHPPGGAADFPWSVSSVGAVQLANLSMLIASLNCNAEQPPPYQPVAPAPLDESLQKPARNTAAVPVGGDLHCQSFFNGLSLDQPPTFSMTAINRAEHGIVPPVPLRDWREEVVGMSPLLPPSFSAAVPGSSTSHKATNSVAQASEEAPNKRGPACRTDPAMTGSMKALLDAVSSMDDNRPAEVAAPNNKTAKPSSKDKKQLASNKELRCHVCHKTFQAKTVSVYLHRRRICYPCQQAAFIINHSGKTVRYCQLCKHTHPLTTEFFEGTRRSCSRSLAKHNEDRKKRAAKRR